MSDHNHSAHVPGCFRCDLSAAETVTTPALITLTSPTQVRAYLDRLNDAGLDHIAAGMTATGAPFLVALCGAYADSEVVIYGNPWDTEVDYTTGTRCDECGAEHLAAGLASLTMPVTVLARPDA